MFEDNELKAFGLKVLRRTFCGAQVTANIYLPQPNNPQLDPYLTFAQQIPFNRELLPRERDSRRGLGGDYVQFAGRRHN